MRSAAAVFDLGTFLRPTPSLCIPSRAFRASSTLACAPAASVLSSVVHTFTRLSTTLVALVGTTFTWLLGPTLSLAISIASSLALTATHVACSAPQLCLSESRIYFTLLYNRFD